MRVVYLQYFATTAKNIVEPIQYNWTIVDLL
jgi:hypothetical protein